MQQNRIIKLSKKIAQTLDSKPGNDMLTAIKIAKQNNSKMELIDRDIQITFKHIWSILSFWDKCNLPLTIFFSEDDKTNVTDNDIKNLLETDSLELMLKNFDKHHKTIKTVIIDERDSYIANNINLSDGKNIVAVLGKAHLPGVTNLLNTSIHLNNTELETIPEKKSLQKLLIFSSH